MDAATGLVKHYQEALAVDSDRLASKLAEEEIAQWWRSNRTGRPRPQDTNKFINIFRR